ncbi:hypothetical protein ACFL5G_02800 [Candidatus Margulisiibacteriota bacterium]
MHKKLIGGNKYFYLHKFQPPLADRRYHEAEKILKKLKKRRATIWQKMNIKGFYKIYAEYFFSAAADLRSLPQASSYLRSLDIEKWPALTTSRDDMVIYMDVWEQPLASVEDDELVDPALSGADTSSRTTPNEKLHRDQELFPAKAIVWRNFLLANYLQKYLKAIDPLKKYWAKYVHALLCFGKKGRIEIQLRDEHGIDLKRVKKFLKKYNTDPHREFRVKIVKKGRYRVVVALIPLPYTLVS